MIIATNISIEELSESLVTTLSYTEIIELVDTISGMLGDTEFDQSLFNLAEANMGEMAEKAEKVDLEDLKTRISRLEAKGVLAPYVKDQDGDVYQLNGDGAYVGLRCTFECDLGRAWAPVRLEDLYGPLVPCEAP